MNSALKNEKDTLLIVVKNHIFAAYKKENDFFMTGWEMGNRHAVYKTYNMSEFDTYNNEVDFHYFFHG